MRFFKCTHAKLYDKIRELERRVDCLESANKYYTDDEWRSWSEIKSVPLCEVVRRMANHIGMQVKYKYPEPPSFTTTFKEKKR